MKIAAMRPDLTPREREEFEQDLTIAERQAHYGLKVKELELQIKRVETNWNQVWRIPLAIIILPVKFVMAFAIITSLITKKELPKEFWEFMHG